MRRMVREMALRASYRQTCLALLISLGFPAGAGAAIALDSHSSNSGSSPYTASLTTTAGDLLVVVVDWNNQAFTQTGVTLSDDKRDTFVFAGFISNSNSNGYVDQAMYYSENVFGGSTTVTVTTSMSAALVVEIFAYAGVAKTGSLENFGHLATPVTSATPAVNLTTTTANDLLIAMVGDPNGSTQAFTAGSGYIKDSEISGTAGAMYEHLIAGAAGTYAADASLLHSNHGWVITAAAFAPEGTPSKLVFPQAPISVAAGACSGGISLQLQDTTGRGTSGGPTSVTLSSSSSSGAFYLSPGCADAPVTAASVPTRGLVNLFYMDAVAGNPTLTASSAGLSNGTQTELIVAGGTAGGSGSGPGASGGNGNGGGSIVGALPGGAGPPAGGPAPQSKVTSSANVGSGCSAGDHGLPWEAFLLLLGLAGILRPKATH